MSSGPVPSFRVSCMARAFDIRDSSRSHRSISVLGPSWDVTVPPSGVVMMITSPFPLPGPSSGRSVPSGMGSSGSRVLPSSLCSTRAAQEPPYSRA